MLTELLLAITSLASTPAIIAAALALAFTEKHPLERRKILLSFAILFMVVYPVKILVGRPRPTNAFISDNLSFPSGHSAFSMLVGLWLWKRWKTKKVLLVFIYPLVIGLTRIMLGVHHISDVIGGFAIATIVFLMVGRWTMNSG